MKRIRVEVEVPDHEVEWLRSWKNPDDGLDRLYPLPLMRIRSVEVVEPERWTELVLRGGPDRGQWVAGIELVAVLPREMDERADGSDRWTVVSCTEREEYRT